MDRTAQFYSAPTYHFRGAGFPVYAGARRQRGGNVLGALQRLAMPILNSLKQKAIKESWGLAKGVMFDTLAGKGLKQSLINRGKKSAKNIGVSIAGSALRSVRRKAERPTPKKRASTAKKRKRSQSTLSKQSTGKRRRFAKNF